MVAEGNATAAAQPEALCRLTGDFPNCIRQVQPPVLPADAAQEMRERAVQARMRAAADVEPVADDVRERVSQGLPQIRLALVELQHIDSAGLFGEEVQHDVD